MTSLVIAEHDNKVLKDATAKTVSAATQLGAPVHVLVAGDRIAARSPKPRRSSPGVEKVLVADAPLSTRRWLPSRWKR